MTPVKRVLVVGGGIGGLSAAIALRKVGIETDLVEKNSAWSVYGVGIIQPGNALRALDQLGLAREAVAAGHQVLGDRTFLRDGETVIADGDWPVLVDGLPPGNGITRPRLHQIFQRHTLDVGTDVRTGVTVAKLTQTGDRVAVAFSDGDERDYDLVVGADGIRSQIRETIFGAEYAPNYTGQLCWRYNLARIGSLDKIWVFLGETGTVGLVPLSEDLMYMFCIEKPPAGTPIRPPQAGSAAVLRERLAEYGGVVADQRELIGDDAAVVVRPVENVLVDPPWHQGRVVLLGDAAHATSPHCGQGAAQAIEDAIVLAEEVATDRELEASLAAYSARRFDRCKMIVEGSEAIGAWEQDKTLPLDPVAKRIEVLGAATAPL